MAATTTKGLRYPQNADAPNVAVDFQNLATDVDTELDNYILASAPPFTSTAALVADAVSDLFAKLV